jgi:hypothetical protein
MREGGRQAGESCAYMLMWKDEMKRRKEERGWCGHAIYMKTHKQTKDQKTTW